MKEFNSSDYGTIRAYVDGELEGEALALFKKRLEDEPDLQEETEAVRRMIGDVRHQFYLDEVNTLVKKGEEAAQRRQPVRRLQIPVRWYAAASVVLLTGIAAWLILHSTPPAADNPLTETDTPDLTITASDIAAIQIDMPLNLPGLPQKLTEWAEKLEDESERGKALKALQQLEKSPPRPVDPGEERYGSGIETPPQPASGNEDAYRLLLLGVGHLREGRPQESLAFLKQVSNKSLAQDVLWYESLAYLQSGDEQASRAALTQITDKRYLSEAKALLEKLP